MLGATAIAERKLQHANPLPILGFDVGVGRAGVIFQPEGDKKEQWMLQIRTALVRMRLDGGEASSLAGRLSFATPFSTVRVCMYVCAQTCFAIVCLCRMGRAMLMPIFKQIRKATSEVDEELEKALRWWLTVLREDICEIRFMFAFLV